MGVDLRDVIEKESIKLEELDGKVVAIDGMNALYQFLASIRQEDGTPLKDFKGNITAHLSGIFYRTSKFVKEGIKPYYIFDGKPPPFKEETRAERAETRKEAEEKWKKALEEERFEEAKRYAQGSSRLTKEMVEETKRLLGYMGVPWVQAESEGEAQGAWMVEKGLAYAVASQDYDSLLFGCPVLVRNLSLSGKRKVPRQNRFITVEPEMIFLDKVLKKLEINREQLSVVGLMCGTDFNKGVRGVGPKTGLKIVKEYKKWKKVKEHIKEKYSYEFEEYIDDVYKFFLNPPHKEASEFRWGEVSLDGLKELLVEEHDFNEERIERVGEGIMKNVGESKNQRKISAWFE